MLRKTPGLAVTFFVVASTDMDRVPIMTARIREQLVKIPGLTTHGALTLSASALKLPDRADPLEKQLREIAERVTEAICVAIEPTQN